jgi:hypothetical protein
VTEDEEVICEITGQVCGQDTVTCPAMASLVQRVVAAAIADEDGLPIEDALIHAAARIGDGARATLEDRFRCADQGVGSPRQRILGCLLERTINIIVDDGVLELSWLETLPRTVVLVGAFLNGVSLDIEEIDAAMLGAVASAKRWGIADYGHCLRAVKALVPHIPGEDGCPCFVDPEALYD